MPLNAQKIRAICFDIDGTLRDTDDMYVLKLQSWIRPLALFYRPLDSPKMARRLVYVLEDPGTFIIDRSNLLGIDGLLSRLSDFIDRLTPKRYYACYTMRGIHNLLSQLRPHYKLAVVSVRSKRKTMAFLENCGLTSYFDAIAHGQTCRYTKPRPDPIRWIAQQMGLSPAECLVVGDTTIDIRAGKAAGAQTAGVTCGFGQEEDLRRTGADIILPSPIDLLFYLLPPKKS
jgi:phosphoglycolate phosphatase-like HAD superfamily hydrolase